MVRPEQSKDTPGLEELRRYGTPTCESAANTATMRWSAVVDHTASSAAGSSPARGAAWRATASRAWAKTDSAATTARSPRLQHALGDGGVGLPALSEGCESRRRRVGQRIGPSPGRASRLGCQDDTDHQGQ